MKRLNGWEPRSETIYEYDDAGRLLRAVTTAEPEWDQDERAWALALLEVDADTCPGCSGQISETTSPESEFSYKPSAPVRCHRCTAISMSQAAYHDNPNVKHSGALLWSAERK